jgi:NAD(P) transhydrogenase subunit alpha
MFIGVLKEPVFENGVSLLAESIAPLVKKGVSVYIETGAGEKASCNDDDYSKSGAAIKPRNEIIASADIILTINDPEIPVGDLRSSY